MPDRVILAIDGSTVATGVALYVVGPERPLRSSLVAWAVIIPDAKTLPHYDLSSARSYWIVLAVEAWALSKGYRPTEVVAEERRGLFASYAPEVDALVRDFRKYARNEWRAQWTAYAPNVWRSRVGGHDKAQTAIYLKSYLEWKTSAPPPMTELGLNAWDAIGVGLHYLNETRPGMAAPASKPRPPASARPTPGRARRTDYRQQGRNERT